jgi:hypothetical protein
MLDSANDDLRLCRPDLRKASGFPAGAGPPSSSVQAGRLSLPACTEEVFRVERPSERQNLSASQAAEPQVVANGNECNLAKRGQALALQWQLWGDGLPSPVSSPLCPFAPLSHLIESCIARAEES